MADEPTYQQSETDDQELAKVLAGVSKQVDQVSSEESNTPEPAVQQNNAPVTPVSDDVQPAATPVADVPAPMPAAPTSYDAPASSGNTGLDNIKLEALKELRPLVDKLDVSPEERFDTYLLLLRSTDDKDLIAPAHEAAKSISDEARRAQALLDIIKEIDFLNQNAK